MGGVQVVTRGCLRVLRQLGGDLNGICVDVDGVLNVFAVASRHGDDDRYRSREAFLQDQAIPGGEALLGHQPSTEAVPFVRIGAGQIEDDVGLAELEGAGHAVLPCLKEKHVTGSIGQGQVEVAWDFDEGEILAPVDRESEDG